MTIILARYLSGRSLDRSFGEGGQMRPTTRTVCCP